MSTERSLAIIGLGPRAISTLERLTAALESQGTPGQTQDQNQAPLTLHLIDDAGPGGRIWDPQQSDTFVMNTFAHGMMLFAEPGSTVENPVVEGPTIYEWINLAIGNRDGISPERQAYYGAHPAKDELVERYGVEELAAYREDSFLPRAIYGYYLQWLFDSLIARLPEWVTPVRHRARAVAIDSDGAKDTILLDNAEVVTSHATIAVTGWQRQAPNAHQRELAAQVAKHPELIWIAPDNPLEQDLDAIPAGENVFIRGLGMGFFDVLAATTTGRGGRFVEDPATRSGLTYLPAGQEPVFLASSNRGYPFLPQCDFGALPTPADLPRVKQVFTQLATRTGTEAIDYTAEVYPAVARDAYQVYVEKLPEHSLRTPREQILHAIDTTAPQDLPALIARTTTERFDLEEWHRPLRFSADNAEDLTAAIAEGLANDIDGAARGIDTPVRAALWTIGCARKPTQILGAEGRYTRESRRHFDRVIALGQMACSGPPLFRTRQLLALIDAGIVRFLGEAPELLLDDAHPHLTMRSPSSGNVSYFSRVLVDAWVDKPDVGRGAGDPFVASVFEHGRARAFAAPTPTASLDLCPETRRVIHPDGTRDARLHFVGIPAHDQYPDTTISPPVPGTDPWFIQETDKAALSALLTLEGVK